jgi:S1-C subfamily serine protease
VANRRPLYSRSRTAQRATAEGAGGSPPPADAAPARAALAARGSTPGTPAASGRPPAGSSATTADTRATVTAATAGARARGWRAALSRHERRLWAVATLALAAGVVWSLRAGPPARAPLTPEQITQVVRQNLVEKPLPSPASAAYAAIRGSVVRVVGLDDDRGDGAKTAEAGESIPRNVGTGVVIVDNGTILTNLHVVQGARRLRVTFADGSESDAVMVGAQPENDLAVLRARTVPDDLQAATLRGTGDLQPGDEVLAVGFPFGIGPSASAGVVSGLKREFRSPDGQQMITNLIQFDAAANPGNSGGPLVTMDGAVVGIVTAILNPSKQRVFIGIGFAVPIENAAAAAGMPPF